MQVNFNRTKIRQLKREYKKAVKEKKNTFIFDGNYYDVNYAKYLIEYLENNK